MAQSPALLLSAKAQERRQRAVGKALAAGRGDTAQTELAARIDVPQTTISRWERGTVDLTMEQALQIEVAMGLKPGTLAEAGGYIAPGKGSNGDASAAAIETLIRRCPEIDPDLRQNLILSLRTQVETSRRLARTESITTLPPTTALRRRRAKA